MTMKIIYGGLLALILSACASQETKPSGPPSWVMSESQEYPRSRFITGVGEADTMTDAKSRARAEIAKVFNVSIQSTSSDESYFEQSTGMETYNATAISREIQSSTQQRLEGVKVPEVWQDANNQRYYALAVLPRQITAANLRNDVNQLDDATQSLITNIQNSPSLVQKIRLSGKTIALQQKRALLNRQLQVVSIAGDGVPAKWSADKLMLDRSELISRITVTAMATGKNEQQLQTSLEDALANQGFTVLSSGNYVLKAELDSTALPPQGSWYYEKGSLNISLMGENKQSLGGHVWNFKISSSDPSLTQLRVLEQAKKYLNTELSEKLLDLLDEQ